VILSIFRLVAPVRAEIIGQQIESSIGSVGLVHTSDDSAHSGFTNSNPPFRECKAWDSKGTYDFSDQAGMTLSWYNESRNTSFIFQMCFGLAQIHGLDITQTNYTELANHESTVLGYYNQQMLISRNTSGSDYDQAARNTWGNTLNYIHDLKHGSQGPPCNAPYDRVDDRTRPFPAGDRSPLAAGRRAFVLHFCSDCIPGASDCYPCPGNTACLPNSTAMTTAPFTGNTIVSTTNSEYACVCSSTDELSALQRSKLGTLAGCVEKTVIVTYCPGATVTYSVYQRFIFGAIPFAMISCGLMMSYIKFLLKGRIEAKMQLEWAVRLYDWVLKKCRMIGCCKREKPKEQDDIEDDPILLRKQLEKLGNALGFKPLPTIGNLQNAVELRALSRVMMKKSMTECCEQDVFFSEVVGLKDAARKKWLATEWQDDLEDNICNPVYSKTENQLD